MLREKAKDLGKIMKDFDSSPSWVTCWRERNFIVFKHKHDEKQDHDSEAAENWIVSVCPKIHEFYSAPEIYNCDETGLYFRALPEGTCALKMKNSLVTRNQKNSLLSYLLQTWFRQITAICHRKIC